jgi:hypothetical protein
MIRVLTFIAWAPAYVLAAGVLVAGPIWVVIATIELTKLGAWWAPYAVAALVAWSGLVAYLVFRADRSYPR